MEQDTSALLSNWASRATVVVSNKASVREVPCNKLCRLETLAVKGGKELEGLHNCQKPRGLIWMLIAVST